MIKSLFPFATPVVAVVVALSGLAGCNSFGNSLVRFVPPAMLSTAGSPAFSRGMAGYRRGEFNEAAGQFRIAIDQGLAYQDLVSARKHLAFVYCVTGEEYLCAEEFRRLIELHPSFELEPAEAGHPVWGPVFRSVKKKRSGAAEVIKRSQQRTAGHLA